MKTKKKKRSVENLEHSNLQEKNMAKINPNTANVNTGTTTVYVQKDVMAAPTTIFQRVRHIEEELGSCLHFSAEIRSTLFGEAEANDGLKEVPSCSIESVLYDILTKTCNLRGELERISERLDVNKQLLKGSK